MADQPDANSHPQSARTLAILDDLRAGRQPQEVAWAHGISRQWVHLVRKRAGIPLPPPPAKPPREPKPRPPKQPRPVNPRTLAILEDVQRGVLYRDVAAKHGITTLHVGRLAKQHGVMRSAMNPDWRTRKRPETRNPVTAAIVEDLWAGLSYGEVVAKYGKPRKAIWNIVFTSGIRRDGDKG